MGAAPGRPVQTPAFLYRSRRDVPIHCPELHMSEMIASSPASQVPQPHVLLVEDQERTAHGLQELLSLQGFRVTCAADGPSGLYAARSAPLDAIVLDVRLPGMDGFAVCRALREDEATKDIPIVMLTGLGDTPSKLQGFETGADDYLVKPVPARELAARLRRLISNRVEATTRLHDQRLRVITEIAAAVCDEISGPLAAALGTLDLALLRPGIPADARRDLSQCRTHIWEVASTVAELTDAGALAMNPPSPDRMVHLAPEGHA
jgi:CheY-like chemotaxis protein